MGSFGGRDKIQHPQLFNSPPDFLLNSFLISTSGCTRDAGKGATVRLSPHSRPSLCWGRSLRGKLGLSVAPSATLEPGESPSAPSPPGTGFEVPISGALSGRTQDNCEWCWNFIALVTRTIMRNYCNPRISSTSFSARPSDIGFSP